MTGSTRYSAGIWGYTTPTIVPNDVAIAATVLRGERIESELRQGESLRTEKQPGKQEIEAAERSDAALR